LENSITMQMVMGASPTLKLEIFCGTLSSKIRKLPCGILGMNCPWLLSTATSTVTEVTSDEKVATPTGRSLPLVLYCEGIFGSSFSFSGAVGVGLEPFLGRATVSPF
jgi:hypothetical protein